MLVNQQLLGVKDESNRQLRVKALYYHCAAFTLKEAISNGGLF